MKKNFLKFFLGCLIALGAVMLPLNFAATPNIAQVQAQTKSNANGAPGSSTNPPNVGSCGIATLFSLTCMKWVVAFMSYSLMQLFAFVLTAAGYLLNYSIEQTIIKMKDNIDNLDGINAAWTTIRDLANMGFIFILLYEAILTVIQQSRGAGKTIKNIVIAALFINFSLFFTKVAIDASNILTIGIYDSISRGANNGAGFTYDDKNGKNPGVGLSDAFMRPLGLQTIASGGPAIDEILKNPNNGFTTILINGVMGSILFLIAAVIFVAMSIMLVMRFIIIVFLLILSPLAFLGNVMPGLKKYANQWTETLTGQALFAPLFMIMIWVTLRILNGATFDNTGKGSFASLASQSNGTIALVFNYAIVVSFLVGSLIIAKQTATRGGGMAAQLMNRGSGWGAGVAGAVGFGTAGFLGRQTVGRGANAVVNSKAANKLKTVPVIGYGARRAFNKVEEKVAKNSFDVRNTGIGSTLGTGPGQKGGFIASKKSYAEDQKVRSGIIKKAETEQSINAGIKARDDRTQAEKDKKNLEARRAAELLASGGVITPAITKLDADIDNLRKAIEKAQDEENKNRGTLQKLSDTEVNVLGKKLEHPFVAQNLAPQKFTAAIKNDAHDDARKDKMKDARFKEMNEAIKELDRVNSDITRAGGVSTPAQDAELALHTQTIKDTASKLSVQDMEHVTPSHFNNEVFASNISSGAYDTLTKPDHALLTGTQKADLTNARNASTKRALDKSDPSYSANEARKKIKSIKAKDKAGLDIKYLSNPDVLETYNQDILKKMADEMTDDKKEQLKNAILAEATAPGATPGPRLTKIQQLATWLETGAGADIY